MATEPQRQIKRYDLVTPMLPCKDVILAEFERLLLSGNYINGEYVSALERELAEACGVSEAVGVASGSEALFLALAMAGVKPGDEVITTPYTFAATVEAIVLLDAVPVFVDIQPTDLNIDPGLIADAITDRTRAICPVHIFGAPCDMIPIAEIGEQNGIEVIADMAQAFGTLYNGKPCGSFARMSSLSFYPTKNLPGIGDGGMIFCREEGDADRIRRLRGHQAIRLNGHLYAGWNSRLDEVQALAIIARHACFKDEQIDRDQVAAIYDRHIPATNRLQTPNSGRGMRVTYHQYWVRTSRRDELRQRLSAAGVDTGVYYDPPLHKHELAEYCRAHGELREAERAGAEVLTLPIHAALPFADAELIGSIVKEFLQAES